MCLEVGFQNCSYVIKVCFSLFEKLLRVLNWLLRKEQKNNSMLKKYLFVEALEGHLNQYGDICNVSQVVAYDLGLQLILRRRFLCFVNLWTQCVFRCLHHILYPICFSFLNDFSLKNVSDSKRQRQDSCQRSVIFIAEDV